jgi:hypothetical protein
LDKTSLPEISERADRAYAARQEIQNVRASVELLRRVHAEFATYKIAWRLSRALFFLGQEAEGGGTATQSVPDARNFYLEGAQAGRYAARLQPEQVAGHFWVGVNLALLAAREQRFKAAAHAWQAKRALQRAIGIDAAYHAAGPLRVLARLQHKAPRWLGGGRQNAQANFERAIKIAPVNTVTRIYFAELLLEAGDAMRASAELESIINAPFDQEWAFEITRDQLRAREILTRLSSFNE